MHAKLLSGGQDDATHNRLGTAGLEGTGGTGRPGCGAGGQRRSQDDTQTTSAARLDAAAEPGQASRHGPGRGAGGRRRGLAGLRDDAPSEARGADGSRAGRRPPAHTAAGPDDARKTRGVTSTAVNQAGPQAPAKKLELLVVLRVLVGLAAVGAPERADRRHLFGRQREREDVEVLALTLRVTGLGQGQGAELVVPAQNEA